jgi:hypothetical protein
MHPATLYVSLEGLPPDFPVGGVISVAYKEIISLCLK